MTFLASLVASSIVMTVLAAAGFFMTVLTLYALAAAVAFMIGVSACVTAGWCEGRLEHTRVPVLAAGAALTLAALVLMLIGGVQGLILRQFAIVFAATGVATAVTSLTVVPALAGLFRLRVDATETPAAVVEPASSAASFVAFGAVLALALAALAIASRMPQDLVPNEDFGVVLVDIKTREGTSRPAVAEVVAKTYEKILKVCEIEKSCSVFGEGIFSGSGENVAKMYLVLKPWSERGKGESTLETIARIRRAVSDIPNAEVSLLSLPTVPGIGTAAHVSPLVLSTADSDPVRLANEAHRLQAILKQSPLADGVTCGYNTDAPHLRIHVDRAKCETLGVPLATLFSTLQHYLGSIYVNDINLGIQVNRVTLMSDWKGRSTPEATGGLYVRSKSGAMVPVGALVDFEEELGPRVIYRYNRYIYCTVDMAQKAGVSLHDAMDEISRVFARELPRDYDTGWVGIAHEEESNPGRLALFVSGVPLSLYSRLALVVLVVANAAFSLFDAPSTTWRRRAVVPLMAAVMALPLVLTSGAGAKGSCSFGMTLLGGYLFYAFVGLPLARFLSFGKNFCQSSLTS